MNILGILVGYLSVIVIGITTLIALGLLIACQMKGARIVFASGFFTSAIIMAMAALTFLAPNYHPGEQAPLLVLVVLSLLVMGTGQFVAALRSGRIFAAAFACTAFSLFFLTVPMLGGDWVPGILRELIPNGSPLFLIGASLLLAVASLLCAMLLPSAPKPRMPAFDYQGRTLPADDVDPAGITVLTKENIFRGKPPG